MSILYLLLPIALVFLTLAVIIFFWAIKNGQYDDMQSQAMKIVIEDHLQQKDKTVSSSNSDEKSSGKINELSNSRNGK
ncbi:MAG: cbb3-type cytochrome oxidase assembly protein CcoS [Gammaproteobacteria bacterium]|nr:cbb3-type cytochrome oxidase assembly protein CcoS [Gammaproteobacteria bacterium]